MCTTYLLSVGAGVMDSRSSTLGTESSQVVGAAAIFGHRKPLENGAFVKSGQLFSLPLSPAADMEIITLHSALGNQLSPFPPSSDIMDK